MEKTIEFTEVPNFLKETEKEFNASLDKAVKQAERGEGFTLEEMRAKYREKFGFDL